MEAGACNMAVGYPDALCLKLALRTAFAAHIHQRSKFVGGSGLYP